MKKRHLLNAKFFGKLALICVMLSMAQMSWAGAVDYKSLYVHAETYPSGTGTIYLLVADGGAKTETDTDNASYSSTEAGTSFDLRFTGATGDPGLMVNANVSVPEGKFLWGYYKSNTPMTPEALDALEASDLLPNQNPVDIKVDNDDHAVDHTSDDIVEGDIKYNEQYTFNATWGDDEWRADHSTPDTYLYAIIKDPFPVNVNYYIGPDIFGSHVNAQDGSYNGTPFGTFTMEPEGAVAGDEITLKAEAAPGFEFAYWTNNANNEENALEVLSPNATYTTEATSSIYVPVFRLAPVEISDVVGWTTYSVPTKIAFVDSESKNTLKAYAVVSRNGNELELKQMKYSTAGFGLVCNADGGWYGVNYAGLVVGNYSYVDFETGDADEPLSDNLLVGTATESFTIPADDAEYNYYVLANKSHGVGFYLAAGGVEVPQNKAYLKMPKASSAKTFYGFDSETTALMSVSNDCETGRVVMYNTAGQQVDDTYKGIVIANGKKFINK